MGELENDLPFAETGGASLALLVFPKCDTGGSLEVAVILILDAHPRGFSVRPSAHELERYREQIRLHPQFSRNPTIASR